MFLYGRQRCAILKKNDISIFFGIFSIMIIRRYFAECVIVLISDYRAQLQFMIFFIFCAQFTSVINQSFHLSLNRFLPFNKVFFLKVHLLSQIVTCNQSIKIIHIQAVTKQIKPVSSKLISAEVASEDVFTHYLMQLRGTWSALTSYKCII